MFEAAKTPEGMRVVLCTDGRHKLQRCRRHKIQRCRRHTRRSHAHAKRGSDEAEKTKINNVQATCTRSSTMLMSVSSHRTLAHGLDLIRLLAHSLAHSLSHTLTLEIIKQKPLTNNKEGPHTASPRKGARVLCVNTGTPQRPRPKAQTSANPIIPGCAPYISANECLLFEYICSSTIQLPPFYGNRFIRRTRMNLRVTWRIEVRSQIARACNAER